MTDNTIYSDIRPYRDHEVEQVVNEIVNSELADKIISAIFPEELVEQLKKALDGIDNIKDFQEKFIVKIIDKILLDTSSGLSKSGLENINNTNPKLFISNHRDIVLDAVLLNRVFVAEGHETVEVAIGDNLLNKPWIKHLVRLNKCFIVQRNLSARELMKFSQLMSKYIYETVAIKKHSLWIAQRQGRAKDGNDRTQPGLLNMLGMSSSGSLREYFSGLNIIPVSISYEYDPCDVEKVKYLYAMKFSGGYTKEKNEDIESMKKGIFGYKGNIHYHFGNPIKDEINALPDDLRKNEFMKRLGSIIDKYVIGNYKMQKNNFIAYDILFGGRDGKLEYSQNEREKFVLDMENKFAEISGNKDELKSIFLQMYARPLQNKIELPPV